MKVRSTSLMLCCVSFLLSDGVHAGGKEILVLLQSKKMVKGELLAVRSNGLLLTQVPGLADEDLAQSPDSLIRCIPVRQILQISMEGTSYTGVSSFVGVLLGLPMGGLVGGLLGGSTTQGNGLDNFFGGVFTGVAIGAIVGGTGGYFIGRSIGQKASSPDVTLVLSLGDRIDTLRASARYREREPDFLSRIIIPNE